MPPVAAAPTQTPRGSNTGPGQGRRRTLFEGTGPAAAHHHQPQPAAGPAPWGERAPAATQRPRPTFQKTWQAIGDTGDLSHFATEARTLIEPVNNFFDAVLVMAEDPAIRANRLGLLGGISALAGEALAWEELG